jgi:putative aldouronate transport system permease protein
MFFIKLKESMKYGIIAVSALPLLALSAAMQKSLVKGLMMGAVKG